MNKPPNKNPKGFSIVEAIVAISLAGIIAVSVNGLLASTHNLNLAGAMKAKATGYAEQSLEIMGMIQNEAFACRCDVYSCDQIAQTCTKNGQTCHFLEGYQSCWTNYPDGNPFYLEEGGGWQLQSGTEIIVTDPAFTREISIENLRRDADNEIVDTGGTLDTNTKKVMVKISWQERDKPREINLSTILTAWDDLNI